MSFAPTGPTVVERLPAQVFLASLICCVTAIPSFIWGRGFDNVAMFTGVAIFILAYIIAWNLRPGQQFFANYYLGKAVRIAYGLRLGASAVFPIGMFLDVYPGVASVAFVESIMGKGEDFTRTLAITLIQGSLLHVGIGLTTLVVYPFVRLSRKPPSPVGLCKVCGYDLRASPERCPECGTPCVKLSASPG